MEPGDPSRDVLGIPGYLAFGDMAIQYNGTWGSIPGCPGYPGILSIRVYGNTVPWNLGIHPGMSWDVLGYLVFGDMAIQYHGTWGSITGCPGMSWDT